MEVDEIQRQVSKFQRVSSNGSTTSTDNSSNPQKLASSRANFELRNHHHVDDSSAYGTGGTGIDVAVAGGAGGGGGVARLCGWPSSRIVRVSRASGGKDRHSKVLTSKGLRDRRVRLSVSTAIQFYDLQDRLGYDQPSKAVEWLLKAAASSIDELPSLDPPFPSAICADLPDRSLQLENGENNANNFVSHVKSPACSSTSETSRGSGLSLSRSENRIKARERARDLVSKKEKEKEIDSARVSVLNQVNNLPETSSFTDLLTGGITSVSTVASRFPNDYFFNRSPQFQIPQFNITNGESNNPNPSPNPNPNHNPNNHQPYHQFSFLHDGYVPPGGGTGGGEGYNLNFGMTSTNTGGFGRGTLQSNLQPVLAHHHHLQRFQSGSLDGSTSTNLPFYIVPNAAVDQYSTAGYQVSFGGDGGGGRRSDHQKDKSKN